MLKIFINEKIGKTSWKKDENESFGRKYVQKFKNKSVKMQK